MVVFVFIVTLLSGGQTLVGKPTMESCEAMRSSMEQVENVQSVTPCVKATLLTPKNDVKGGA